MARYQTFILHAFSVLRSVPFLSHSRLDWPAFQCNAVLNCDVVIWKQAWFGISGERGANVNQRKKHYCESTRCCTRHSGWASRLSGKPVRLVKPRLTFVPFHLGVFCLPFSVAFLGHPVSLRLSMGRREPPHTAHTHTQTHTLRLHVSLKHFLARSKSDSSTSMLFSLPQACWNTEAFLVYAGVTSSRHRLIWYNLTRRVVSHVMIVIYIIIKCKNTSHRFS